MVTKEKAVVYVKKIKDALIEKIEVCIKDKSELIVSLALARYILKN